MRGRRAKTDDSLKDVAEVLVTRDALAKRVAELATDIAADHTENAAPLVLVGVLKGSVMFMADLMRALPLECNVDFMSISSYSAGGRSGVVRILKDLDVDVTGRDVLIVEDIVDTGLTLTFLRRTLEDRGARSLRTVTLLDKSVRRIVPVAVEYQGFETPDVFVVGYGLDFQGRYRNVPDILAVKDIARLANEPELLVPALWPGV